MKSLTIAVDFDSTIVHSHWPDIGDAIPGAILHLRQWHARKHSIIVWTCRRGERERDARRWLDAHAVPYDAINTNLPKWIEVFGGDTRKVFADIYVDDKGAGVIGLARAQIWTVADRAVRRLEMSR